jgi:hypothetical protein
VTHVTVSGVLGSKGKGVTCNGFWGLGEMGMVSHVLVSGLEGRREKVSHVTASGFWRAKG